VKDNLTLDAALDKAMGSEEVEDAQEEETQEETAEELQESEEPKEEEAQAEAAEEFSAEQLAAAKALYKKLSDPKTSVATITSMVKQAGYTLTELKEATKSEQKEIVTDIVDILKEELGDDYDLLAGPKLGQAISKMLDLKVSEALKPLQTKLQEAENATVKKEVDKALDWAYSSLDGFKASEALIAEKMQLYPYTGKVSYKTYLSEMHALATSGAATKRTQRADSNLKNDVKASKSVRPSSTKPTKALTLDEAIDQAMADIRS
jgi:hypothetical protein